MYHTIYTIYCWIVSWLTDQFAGHSLSFPFCPKLLFGNNYLTIDCLSKWLRFCYNRCRDRKKIQNNKWHLTIWNLVGLQLKFKNFYIYSVIQYAHLYWAQQRTHVRVIEEECWILIILSSQHINTSAFTVVQFMLIRWNTWPVLREGWTNE